jgi:hypothetical protein
LLDGGYAVSELITRVGVGVLGSDTVWTCTRLPTCRKNILPPSSGLKWRDSSGRALRSVPSLWRVTIWD